MNTLIKSAQDQRYTEFEPKVKKILEQKTALKLKERGYFDRLSQAVNEKTEYQKFFDKALEKFGAKSPAELSDEKKKEFFDYVDKNWEGENEND
jgi:hypothetical protein